MPDITISTNNEEPAKKAPNIKDIISAASEAEKIEKENERLKKAISERDELQARLSMGGRASAGVPQVEKTPLQIAAEEAKEILKRMI